MARKKVIIGIDPDVDKIGVCILYPNNMAELRGVDSFISFADFLKFANTPIELRVEIAGPKKPLWGLAAQYHQLKNKIGHDKALRTVVKMGMQVGRSYEVGAQIVKYAESLKIEVVRVTPESRVRCDGGFFKKMSVKNISNLKYPSKLDAKRFNELTGYVGRTNKDKRDAALLINELFLNDKIRWE